MDIQLKGQNGAYTLTSASEGGEWWLKEYWGHKRPVEVGESHILNVLCCILGDGLKIKVEKDVTYEL